MNRWCTRQLVRLRTALASEEGQGMTEYGLILILVAIVVLLMLGVLSNQVNNTYSNIGNALTSVGK